MYSANLPGQPNKFPLGKGKMCIAPSTILLGKLYPQYYWIFCPFVLFLNFLYNTFCMVFIYFVADRDISRQINPQKPPWLQMDCCMRNMLSTFHLKEKEHIISATHKAGHPLQKAHPKSDVCCCCCTVRSTLSTLLPLIYSLSLAFMRLVLLVLAGPATCCHFNSYSQSRWWLRLIELWFLCVVTSTQ